MQTGDFLAQTELGFGSENYPTSLDQLVDGVLLANDASGRKKKFLSAFRSIR
jgi:hypothetical protein